MNQIAVIDGRFQVYATTDGRHRRLIGPAFPAVREAIRYADRLDAMPSTSPLPVPAMGSDTNTPVPLRAAGVELIAGSRKRSSGSART